MCVCVLVKQIHIYNINLYIYICYPQMCSIYVFIHLHWTTILMYWRVPEINRSGKSIKIKSFLQDNCCCLFGPFGPFLHWPSPEFAGWFNPLYWHLGVSEVWRWCITNTITPKLPSSNRSHKVPNMSLCIKFGDDSPMAKPSQHQGGYVQPSRHWKP